MRRLIWPAVLAAWIAGGAVAAERPTVWDVPLGASPADLPESFSEFACGTAGGPPGRPLAGFAGYGECPADPSGLHEVYFRYDDEAEYVARALEQETAVAVHTGTRVYGTPVIVSALFDSAGIVRGIRMASDSRGVEPGDRNDHWMLAAHLMHRFGSEGWRCKSLEPEPGETPAATYWLKDRCEKTDEEAALTVVREYYQRRGESFTDAMGKVQPTHFVSLATFERIALSLTR